MLSSHEEVLDDSGDPRKKPLWDIVAGGVNVRLVADSDSPYSIINKGVWEESFTELLGTDLEQADIKPQSFTGEPIKLLGFCRLKFEFIDRSAECKLYVTKNGPSVLGWWDKR